MLHLTVQVIEIVLVHTTKQKQCLKLNQKTTIKYKIPTSKYFSVDSQIQWQIKGN